MGSDILKNVLLPFGLLIGIVRTALIVGLAAVYALVVEGLCRILVSTPQMFTRRVQLTLARSQYLHCIG